jgi:hypothetical protein
VKRFDPVAREFLDPNLNGVTGRPWEVKEFALTDRQLGIVKQQW